MARQIIPDAFIEAERLVAKELKQTGKFIMQELGYHTYFTEIARHTIALINDPTAHYIRTLADRIAINRDLQGVFEVEVKDLRNSEYENAAIEAFPMLIHRTLWWIFGIECIYAFTTDSTIKGCWIQDLPIFKIIVPMRLKGLEEKYWIPKFQQFYPNIPIIRKPTVGSGDPFALIKPETIEVMLSIRKLLGALTHATADKDT